MTTTPDEAEEQPIYDSLIEQRGDVLTETREAAESTEEQAARALDWSDLHIATDLDPGPHPSATSSEQEQGTGTDSPQLEAQVGDTQRSAGGPAQGRDGPPTGLPR